MLPIAIFALLRLPTIVHSPGMQDEQWFSVPGWTVWNEGIPRIPYFPARNRESLFENADRCLMALPPALFYVQAPFHAIFPPGYMTARLPLFLAALLTIVITFGVARSLGAGVGSATLVATIMAVCRPLLFTGTMVRPDLLSAVCGWLSLLLLWRFLLIPKWKSLIGSGFVCGIGGLFHPFALVFAIQAGIAILLARATFVEMVKHLVGFGIACAGAVGLWIPLIIQFPSEFRSQFFANVVDRAGPGLPIRLLWPWPSIRHHFTLVYEFAGPWQTAFFGFALIAASVAVYRTRTWREATGVLLMLWSSVYLTAVVAGIHPTKGYWIYPCVWILAGFAISLDRWNLGRGLRLAVVATMLLAMMVPGSGLRSVYLYASNWGDPKYHAPTFIAGVLSELPDEGLFMADLSYVYDVYLSGRETLLCQERHVYGDDRELEYEAILLAWEGEDADLAQEYNAVLWKRFGSNQPIQSCFVDVYLPAEATDE